MNLNDPIEFRKIYDSYVDLLYFVLKELSVPLEERDDIVQEAFLRLLRSADSVDHQKIKGFLVVTAKNLVIDKARRARFRKTESVGEIPEGALSFSPEDDEDRKMELKVVGELIREFSQSSGGETFSLFYENGMSVKEIALQLGEPVGTITARLSRMRQKFKDKFKKQYGGAVGSDA